MKVLIKINSIVNGSTFNDENLDISLYNILTQCGLMLHHKASFLIIAYW